MPAYDEAVSDADMFPIFLNGALDGLGPKRSDAPEGRFPPAPDSVPAARRFVLDVGWSEDSELNLRLATLVSEIVTNAVLHARTPFTVKVLPTEQTIRVSVSDGSTALPIKKKYEATQPTGRGLHIVEATADRWGISPRARGKTIWFELDRVGANV